MKPTQKTQGAFDKIAGCSIFRLGGGQIDICDTLIDLVNAIKEEPEDSDWVYIGESGEFTCSDLIVGAYWAMSHCHSGQYSKEYAALCSLGTIFSPGMSSEPEEDDSEYLPYEAICKHFCP